MVFIMLKLHEPLWVFIYLTDVPLFLNNCVWVSFVDLHDHILATLPSLCSWCSPSSHSWCFSKFLLFFPSFHSWCFSSSHFCYSSSTHSCCSYQSRSCYSKLVTKVFCCSKFTFLLHFSMVFLLLQAPNKSSCCSKFAFLLFFSVMFLLLQITFLLFFSIVFLLLQACVQMLLFIVVFLPFQACVRMLFFPIAFFCSKLTFLVFKF
jgi:hypothetical protein